jgi:hypothetical protein
MDVALLKVGDRPTRATPQCTYAYLLPCGYEEIFQRFSRPSEQLHMLAAENERCCMRPILRNFSAMPWVFNVEARMW